MAAGDGPRLEVCISGPLVVLRASKSVLASDAALEVLAARFGDTLRVSRGGWVGASGGRWAGGWVDVWFYNFGPVPEPSPIPTEKQVWSRRSGTRDFPPLSL